MVYIDDLLIILLKGTIFGNIRDTTQIVYSNPDVRVLRNEGKDHINIIVA